ncbi:MAG: coniferyl-aldehyde dehydrogenase, partial [Alphaproteobacteria bacterium]
MAQTAQLRLVESIENEAQRIFALQRKAYLAHPYPTLAERKENLRKLDRILSENSMAIAEAINADFGHRSIEESLMAEVFASVDGIRHALKHVG